MSKTYLAQQMHTMINQALDKPKLNSIFPIKELV